MKDHHEIHLVNERRHEIQHLEMPLEQRKTYLRITGRLGHRAYLQLFLFPGFGGI